MIQAILLILFFIVYSCITGLFMFWFAWFLNEKDERDDNDDTTKK
jgi:hypothetical protein